MSIQALCKQRWAGLAVALGALVVTISLRAADPAVPSRLTEEERGQLEKQATELNVRAFTLYQQGRYPEATKLLEQALALLQRLYPTDKYPQGHPDLAASRRHLGMVLQAQREYGQALASYKQALEMNQRLYTTDKYPQGHPYLAQSLHNLGSLLHEQGDYGRALGYHKQALAMRQRLYPADRYPQGHPDLAQSLNNLGTLLNDQCEYGQALGYYQQALAMRQRLYPADRYPEGNRDLAQSLNNLGTLLENQGEYSQALGYLKQALEMEQRLYPADKYPQGHPHLAVSLDTLGTLLENQGDYGRALGYSKQALEMNQRLYPTGNYPAGHPDLALSLNNLGRLLQAQGDYGRALGYHKQALEMRQRLYPADKFPQGHPLLAQSLNNLGSLLKDQCEYGQALGYLKQALEMDQRLYPADKYPQGHRDLAQCLNNLGTLLLEQGEYGQALGYLKQALEMRQRLYPADKFPQGHPHLAEGLNNLGALLKEQGEYGQALGYLKQALEMNQRLYPADKYPQGHPHLAYSLHNLGGLLQDQGEYGQALGYSKQALAMYQRLYPADNYPKGHPDLATSLNNLGTLLGEQGEYGQALGYLKQALAMRQRLYPADQYPQGHPLLAQSLNILGNLLECQGEYGQALGYSRQALEMCQRLYPTGKYPAGHPDLALSLHNLGRLLQAQGQYAQALGYLKQALEMYQRLYPTDQYPQGHPDLARGLNNLGDLLQAQGEYAQALGYHRQALDMHGRLASAFADTASEAEALNYLARLPSTRSNCLSCSAALPDASPEVVYAALWRHKAAATAVLQRRQLVLHAAADDATRRLAANLLDARRQLARLLLASADVPLKDREQRLADLTARKESLERKLAEMLPDLARQQALQRAPHTDLLKQLPPDTAFVDLLHYYPRHAKELKWGEPRYVAFVLQPGEPVRRAELGPAAPIEQALAQWRQDIENGRAGTAADQLRRLAWEPVARLLRQGTDTIYLAPEGPLATLPWAALPGSKPGSVLLEEYALALVPHGPFLLDQLTPAETTRPGGTALVLGGVQYAQGPEPFPDAQPDSRRAADLGRGGITWPALPGTTAEADQVAALARRLAGAEVVELRGRQAGTERLLRELPKARWAHLATHGFFAARQNEDERQRLLREADFGFGVRTERRGAGARNPLVQTGLVLAGANLPPKDDPLADDRGLLTAEALAGLDLRRLDLCVLSACNTGRGEAVGGEGVFGLQLALHLGGCRNVVASLWKVDDDATAALMALFYRDLWEKKQPPLQALRHAQLVLRRHPGTVPLLAKERGPNFDTVVKRVEEGPAEPPAAGDGARVKHWAAFVLSGLGR
jgi:tetratricopeptide (TPR) repeat protein